MAELIKRINKFSHPMGLNFIINISLIIICIQLTLNTNELSNTFIMLAYSFVSLCFYYFNFKNADS